MASLPHSTPALPATVGRFQPLRVLGQGGQGVVYLAFDPKLDREVVLKVLNRRARDPARLLNEARNVAKLDHPNIVGLFEIELDTQPSYLVYQFAPGRALSEFCSGRDSLPIKRTVEVIIRVLDALHYAHQRQFLHRDLTPANILIDDQDQPRILDFGISVVLNDASGSHDVAGTPHYLAPEIFAKQAASAGSDLFAVSVVMHEMLCGKRLFQADNPRAVIYKIVNERILPPSMGREGVDAALDTLIMKGLEKDPSQRYQSADQMRDALQAYLQPPLPANEANKGNGGASHDVKGAIAFLQRRMARKPDFPAVSRHIAEINSKADARTQSHVNDLAGIILKDYALTTKLLKIVNSAVYGQYGGSISTVSRAVVILGLEQVRAIALGIVIFEHLRNGDQAAQLKDAACSSFLSAMLARSICQSEQPRCDSEEAFIGAMFHRLGRHLAIYYFPDEYRDVQGVMESHGLDEASAAREIFGADFAEFGIAIGREWNLPESMIQAMRPQRAGKVKAGNTPEQLIAQFSAFSNEAAEIAGGDARDMEQKLKTLLERYAECIKFDTAKLKATVVDAVNATREYAGMIRADLANAPLLGKVERAMRDAPASIVSAGEVAGDELDEGTLSLQATTQFVAETDAERGLRRHSFLTNAIGELTNAIIERASVNDMFTMVLEALYRSMGFDHVLLMIRDPARKSFVARFGFGHDIETLKSRFEFKLEGGQDIFSLAVQKGRNAVIVDTSDERCRGSIPTWCRELTQPRSILVFSVLVNKICIAVIYADCCSDTMRVNAQELQVLNTLVKQLTLGVRQH